MNHRHRFARRMTFADFWHWITTPWRDWILDEEDYTRLLSENKYEIDMLRHTLETIEPYRAGALNFNFDCGRCNDCVKQANPPTLAFQNGVGMQLCWQCKVEYDIEEQAKLYPAQTTALRGPQELWQALMGTTPGFGSSCPG